jgi:hypothetical protein
VFSEDDLVHIQLGCELSKTLCDDSGVGFQAAPAIPKDGSSRTNDREDLPFPHNLHGRLHDRRDKISELDGGCLLEESALLEPFGQEGRALVCVFLGEVAADGAAFIEDEAIVILVATMNGEGSKGH